MNVYGDGLVGHGTYAHNNNAEAWTSGGAGYVYDSTGTNSVSGAGFAGTGGYSTVIHTPGATEAHAGSISFAGSGTSSVNPQ